MLIIRNFNLISVQSSTYLAWVYFIVTAIFVSICGVKCRDFIIIDRDGNRPFPRCETIIKMTYLQENETACRSC